MTAAHKTQRINGVAAMPENCLEWQEKLTQVNQQLKQAQAKIAELEALNQGVPQATPSLRTLQSATDRYFQKIIDRSSYYIVLTDAATNILYSNSVVQILRYSVEEYIAILDSRPASSRGNCKSRSILALRARITQRNKNRSPSCSPQSRSLCFG